jgi:riboflavin kinase / FMN adenylyltransferase
MNILRDKPFHFKNPVVTMGNFDGVHIGHQKLLELIKRRAKEIEGESIVLTYYHHPFETLHKKPYPYLLTEKAKKEQIILDMGIDHVLFLHFDDKIANMTADDFLEDILIKLLHPVEIVVGYDSRFGRNRCGDYKYLKANEEKYGYHTMHVPPVKCSGQIVSSTLIRKCISEGLIQEAQHYLNRHYSVAGKVIYGKGIGHQIGYPTINLLPDDPHKIIPRRGIYLTYTIDSLANKYFGLTNIGYSPTLKIVDNQEIETYLLNFKGNIYDEKVEIFFLQRIRDEIQYPNKEALQEAIAADVAYAIEQIPLYSKGLNS